MLEFSSKHLENFKNSFVKFSEIFLTSWDSDTSAQNATKEQNFKWEFTRLNI